MTLGLKIKQKLDEVTLVILSILIGFFYIIVPMIYANTLTSISIFLNDSRPSATSVSYTNRFSNITTGTAVSCIKVKFSDASSGGSKPTGMNISSATLDTTNSTFMSSWSGWSASPNNSTGEITITHATGVTPSGGSDKTVIFTSITNGSTVNTVYYSQVYTYTGNDCSTGPTDNGVASFTYSDGVLVTVSVEPAISLSVGAVASGSVNSEPITTASTATTVPFGLITASTKKVAAHDITVATNAVNGYTVSTRYTGPLFNGTVNWTNHTGTNASPTTFAPIGTEAFGYTTEDFTLQNIAVNRFDTNKWAGYTTTPLEVIYNGGAVAAQTTRVGYQLTAAGNTQSGLYSTTVVYIATPVY